MGIAICPIAVPNLFGDVRASFLPTAGDSTEAPKKESEDEQKHHHGKGQMQPDV